MKSQLRPQFEKQIQQAFQNFPIVAILGPRQCGKTTLSKMYCSSQPDFENRNFFDCEDYLDLERLSQPKLAFETLEGLVVIDEVQRLPDLFPYLRVQVDKLDNDKRFLILGSASRLLIKQSSESLAGRIHYIELTPFDASEVADTQQLWHRGGFPGSYLAMNDSQSQSWRKSYIRTFLEQDIPNLGFQIPPRTLHRFWMMLAHFHGQIFNASQIGQSLGISSPSIRRYLDILTGTFMVRELTPWLENTNKRQVKMPKIYFRDSGLYHTLMNITDTLSLERNPNLGASWEGFALEEVIRHYQADPEECFFWAVHQQGEIDLVIFKNGKRLGFEFKYTDKPKMTKSVNQASEILRLDDVFIVSPGTHDFDVETNVHAVGLSHLLTHSQNR